MGGCFLAHVSTLYVVAYISAASTQVSDNIGTQVQVIRIFASVRSIERVFLNQNIGDCDRPNSAGHT